MAKKQDEIAKRTASAKAAIQEAIDDKSSVRLFVSHHLDELKTTYWIRHAGTPKPSPQQVIDLLELHSHWGGDGEDGTDRFDFTIPDDVTDYVICVKFNDDGKVESVDMES